MSWMEPTTFLHDTLAKYILPFSEAKERLPAQKICVPVKWVFPPELSSEQGCWRVLTHEGSAVIMATQKMEWMEYAYEWFETCGYPARERLILPFDPHQELHVIRDPQTVNKWPRSGRRWALLVPANKLQPGELVSAYRNEHHTMSSWGPSTPLWDAVPGYYHFKIDEAMIQICHEKYNHPWMFLREEE